MSAEDRSKTGELNSTVKAILKNTMDLDDFAPAVMWPPDIFAITSIILEKTGNYRHIVSELRDEITRAAFQLLIPNEKHEDHLTWTQLVDATAQEWIDYLTTLDPASAPLKVQKRLSADQTTEDTPGLRFNNLVFSLNEIREGRLCAVSTKLFREAHNSYNAHIDPENEQTSETSTDYNPATNSFVFCTTLLLAHACADAAFGGIGFLSLRKIAQTWIHPVASSLLGTRHTLSRMSRSHGVVLPKLRTPSIGLTLRSLSHNLTFHDNETEVHWRTLPWTHLDGNSLHILLVPWPKVVSPSWFRPYVSESRPQMHHARHFTYRPDTKLDVSRIMAVLESAQSRAERIDMIVFPEASLTDDELSSLKYALEHAKIAGRLPLIVTGIRREPMARTQESVESSEKKEQQPESEFKTIPTKRYTFENLVVVSYNFADQWYDIEQPKHHKWMIDKRQIDQYRLSGFLSPNEVWWEAIDIEHRQVSFINPSPWLILCPLICEDLARVDPVPDILRGVGPTLVIALLLDGPQRVDRWPARYASVLADDPGSSVLTFTSLGMARRSVPKDCRPQSTVALWKDGKEGWARIDALRDTEAILLSLSLETHAEKTADGRSDDHSAAYVFSGVQRIRTDEVEEGSLRHLGVGSLNDRARVDERTKSSQSRSTDLAELSIFASIANSLIEMDKHMRDRSRKWIVTLSEGKDKSFIAIDSEEERRILNADELIPLLDYANNLLNQLRQDDDSWRFDESPELLAIYAASVIGLAKNVLALIHGDLEEEANKECANARKEFRESQYRKGPDKSDRGTIVGLSLRALRLEVAAYTTLLMLVNQRLHICRMKGYSDKKVLACIKAIDECLDNFAKYLPLQYERTEEPDADE